LWRNLRKEARKAFPPKKGQMHGFQPKSGVGGYLREGGGRGSLQDGHRGLGGRGDPRKKRCCRTPYGMEKVVGGLLGGGKVSKRKKVKQAFGEKKRNERERGNRDGAGENRIDKRGGRFKGLKGGWGRKENINNFEKEPEGLPNKGRNKSRLMAKGISGIGTKVKEKALKKGR